MATLEQAPAGKIVSLLDNGLDFSTKIKMTQLGLITNSPVKILSNRYNGPLLVLCQSSKIMLSREVCKEIEIREV